MNDDKRIKDAEAALQDMIQWVAAFAMGSGSHGIVMKSPRMIKAKAALERLREGGGREPNLTGGGAALPDGGQTV